MNNDFLSAFMGNARRARVLRVFIFNENEVCTSEVVAKRSGLTERSAIRELNSLVSIGILKKGKAEPTFLILKSGKKKKQKAKAAWYLNFAFPHIRPLASFVREISPLKYEQVLLALKRAGRLAMVVLSGSFVDDNSRPADIIVAADALNEKRLEAAVKRLEPLFGRELRYAAFSTTEFRYRVTIQDKLIRDTFDFPHMVLLDKMHVL